MKATPAGARACRGCAPRGAFGSWRGHELTLPPETMPLRGFYRGAQLNWRKEAPHDVQSAWAR